MSSKISVVIPLYNKRAFIRQTVKSVLYQDTPAWEIIIVNDGSTDGGADLAREEGGDQVRVIDIPNSGVAAARNAGIDAATGEYVAFLDADDWWAPSFLSGIERLIKACPGAGLYAVASLDTNAGEELPPISHAELYAWPIEVIKNYFSVRARRVLFSMSSLCVSRRILQRTGIRFAVGEAHAEDHDFQFRLAEAGPLAYLGLPLAAYRRNVTASLTQVFEWSKLEPAYERLWARTQESTYPRHLRAAARHLVHRRQTSFARHRLVASNDRVGALQLLFLVNYQPGASRFWWGTLLACLLPGYVRRRLLTQGRGWAAALRSWRSRETHPSGRVSP
jgi:glycosyltransferase involved in cell wall biosynthesis